MACVITRFHLNSVLMLPLFAVAFRKIRKQALGTVPGLLKAVFLVESPRVCYSVSLWTNDEAIREFNGLFMHTHAANWGIRQVYNEKRRRAELWSTHWRLAAISHNLRWGDFDLRMTVAADRDQTPSHEAAPVASKS